MKNKVIAMTLLTLTLTLAGCSSRRGAGETRTNSLAPSGDTLGSDVAIAKLGAAYKSTISKDNVSFALNETSDPLAAFSINTVQKNTYTDGTDPVTYTRNGEFSSLSLSGSVSGLASTKADDVKAALKSSFTGSTSYQTNDEEAKTYKTTGVTSKEYFAGETVYLDPSNTKFTTFIVNNLMGLGMSESYRMTLIAALSQKYKMALPLTDSSMPLINDTVLGYVDSLISTLNTHSADYTDFLKGYTLSDGSYAVYLSMTKDDVIKVAHDVAGDIEDAASSVSLSMDSSKIDTELANLEVRSLEFVVNFSESAIISCSTNFDFTNVTETPIYDASSILSGILSGSSSASSSSVSSSSVDLKSKGTSNLTYILKGYMGFSFGTEAPVLPSDDELANGYNDISAIIQKIIAGLGTNS